MKFLVDRCAGRRLAEWLSDSGYDALEAHLHGPDPGDRALLERAEAESRILVTIDTDFGELIWSDRVRHAGLVRLPDVPAVWRIALLGEVIGGYWQALQSQVVVTVRSDRIGTSFPVMA